MALFENILLILAGIILLSFAYAGMRAAPWVPSFKKDMERIMEAAGSNVEGKKVYELGSGDGRVLEAFAKQGAHVTGFELSIAMYLWSCFRVYLRKTPHIRIFFQDFWEKDWKEADIIYLYLMPRIYPKLQEKCHRELRPGSKVIAYAFPISVWTPSAVYEASDRPSIFVYEHPFTPIDKKEF